MTKLLFLSRVALICNICFLITFLMHYVSFMADGIITSTILILGTVMAIVINALLHLLYIMLSLSGKPFIRSVPIWLLITNFLFFVFQIILLVK